MSSGQSAMEYMVILAVMLLVLFPILYFANIQSSVSSAATQGRQAVESIVSAADRVYALGPGSRITINVFIPSGYSFDNSNIDDQVVTMVFFLSDGSNATISMASKAVVKGQLPSTSGYHPIQFSMTEAGYVVIGTSRLSASPGAVSFSLQPSQNDSRVITFTNLDSQTITVNLNLSGPAWLSVNESAFTVNSTLSYSINLSVSPTATGSFYGTLQALDDSNDQELTIVPITVSVTSSAGAISFSTNNNSYTQNNTLAYSGTVVDSSGVPLSNALVSVKFYDNSSTLQQTDSKTTNASGGYSGSYVFASNAPIGWWSATATVGGLSNSSAFYVNGTDTTPPPAVTLTSPANGSTGISRTPTLNWSAVSDPSNPIVYIINLDDSSNFGSMIINTTTTNISYNVTSQLAKNKVHYWRVRAKDAAQNLGNWSGVWNFKTVNQ
ncbi:hypothetical protein HYS54_01670 [Candidatus Micrarchaeota archaeon]|nr:hypothetical protein [Candidatus Micrarchaeota archaeon]